jgi:hypothetical protein
MYRYLVEFVKPENVPLEGETAGLVADQVCRQIFGYSDAKHSAIWWSELFVHAPLKDVAVALSQIINPRDFKTHPIAVDATAK